MPTILWSLFLIAEILCNVLSIPALLSDPKLPTLLTTKSKSLGVISSDSSKMFESMNRASGWRPKSKTTSSNSLIFSF